MHALYLQASLRMLLNVGVKQGFSRQSLQLEDGVYLRYRLDVFNVGARLQKLV